MRFGSHILHIHLSLAADEDLVFQGLCPRREHMTFHGTIKLIMVDVTQEVRV